MFIEEKVDAIAELVRDIAYLIQGPALKAGGSGCVVKGIIERACELAEAETVVPYDENCIVGFKDVSI